MLLRFVGVTLSSTSRFSFRMFASLLHVDAQDLIVARGSGRFFLPLFVADNMSARSSGHFDSWAKLVDLDRHGL